MEISTLRAAWRKTSATWWGRSTALVAATLHVMNTAFEWRCCRQRTSHLLCLIGLGRKTLELNCLIFGVTWICLDCIECDLCFFVFINHFNHCLSTFIFALCNCYMLLNSLFLSFLCCEILYGCSMMSMARKLGSWGWSPRPKKLCCRPWGWSTADASSETSSLKTRN